MHKQILKSFSKTEPSTVHEYIDDDLKQLLTAGKTLKEYIASLLNDKEKLKTENKLLKSQLVEREELLSNSKKRLEGYAEAINSIERNYGDLTKHQEESTELKRKISLLRQDCFNIMKEKEDLLKSIKLSNETNQKNLNELQENYKKQSKHCAELHRSSLEEKEKMISSLKHDIDEIRKNAALSISVAKSEHAYQMDQIKNYYRNLDSETSNLLPVYKQSLESLRREYQNTVEKMKEEIEELKRERNRNSFYATNHSNQFVPASRMNYDFNIETSRAPSFYNESRSPSRYINRSAINTNAQYQSRQDRSTLDEESVNKEMESLSATAVCQKSTLTVQNSTRTTERTNCKKIFFVRKGNIKDC